MSKYYNIKWKQSDNEDLKKAVKNFNAKISRLEKKHPELKNALPEKVTVKQMKELIDTRQDLKRELNALKRFSKRGAEQIVTIPDTDYNIKTTKWQKNEMNRRVAVINRKRKQRYEQFYNVQATSGGEPLGYTVGERQKYIGMGKADEVALKPLKAFTSKMTNADLKRKFASIQKESQSTYWQAREMRLKANYIKSLEENFNTTDITDVIDAIDNMDFEDFYEIFQAEGGDFETSYPPDQEQYNGYVSKLKSIWLPKQQTA